MDIQNAITTRHTKKVLADPSAPWETTDPLLQSKVAELLELAGNAPYHKPAHESYQSEPLTSLVPWRFHALDSQNCRALLERIQQAEIQSGKIASMLAAADALVLTTWLPNPDTQPDAKPSEFQQFAASLQNMEHIAAASAAIQNLLLLATANGWNNYWSSGGVLRSETLYDWLGISSNEVLLGAIFLFPAELRDAQVKTGAMRDRKGPVETWSRWVEVT